MDANQYRRWPSPFPIALTINQNQTSRLFGKMKQTNVNLKLHLCAELVNGEHLRRVFRWSLRHFQECSTRSICFPLSWPIKSETASGQLLLLLLYRMEEFRQEFPRVTFLFIRDYFRFDNWMPTSFCSSSLFVWHLATDRESVYESSPFSPSPAAASLHPFVSLRPCYRYRISFRK